MNFGSIDFDMLLNIVSFPASWVIYNEDALLIMYYYTGKYLPAWKTLNCFSQKLFYIFSDYFTF